MKFELPEPTQSTSAPVETVLKSRRSIGELSDKIVDFPPRAMRLDRRSVLASRGLELGEALPHEASLAADTKRLEAADGAGRFARGAGRHGGNS